MILWIVCSLAVILILEWILIAPELLPWKRRKKK